MFNKSEIFKSAHAATRYERRMYMAPNAEAYSVTFSRMLRAAWDKALLTVPSKPVAQSKTETTKSPELQALEFEHTRRDISCSRYFGSRDYQHNQKRIQELRKAA